MRNTLFFVAGVALLVVQSNLFHALNLAVRLASWLLRDDGLSRIPGLSPSLVLPLILFMGVHEYSLVRGASVACALGYLTDLIGVSPIGLHTSTYVALFVLARAAGVRLAAQTVLMQVALTLGFSLVHSTLLIVLLAIFGRDPWVPRLLLPLVPPHVAATGAVAPLIFRLAQRVHHATTSGLPRDPGAAP